MQLFFFLRVRVMKTSSEDNYLCIPVSVDLSYCSIHLKLFISLYAGIFWEIMSIAGVWSVCN